MPDRAEMIRELLGRLENVLAELVSLQADRQRALARMDTARLDEISHREMTLCHGLQGVAEERLSLLDGESPATSLGESIARLPLATRGELERRFERVSQLRQQVKEEATSNWLAAYRLGTHVESLLTLFVSQNGEESRSTDASGGVLDSRF
ncbi:MAG: flagellar export chaperone FlgN [Planctomycetota bacterium]